MILLTACAAHRETVEETTPNPWQTKAEDLTRAGVNALDRGQWKSAQILFEQSLQSATLADDQRLMSLDWYNLGQTHHAAGHDQQARTAYLRAIRLAEAAGDPVGRMRASISLALIEQGAAARNNAEDESSADSLLKVPNSFPVDIHLAAARLATIRHRPRQARLAYMQVLHLSGKDRSGMLYAARAQLGLAELASADHATAKASRHIGTALKLLHRAGEPRLLLQALEMTASVETDPTLRQQWLARADTVRQALHGTRTE